MSASRSFLALLEALTLTLAAEPAIVSVETESFGTLTRADVARLLPLARRALEADAARAIGCEPTADAALAADVLAPAFDLTGAR